MESADELKKSADLIDNGRAALDKNDFEGLVDEVAGQAWWALTGEQAMRAGEAGFLAMREAIRHALAFYFSHLGLPGLMAVSKAAKSVPEKHS